jgi:hypothetical protein
VHSQSAVVKGAALRGLEGTTPGRTYCRRHYGFVYSFPFEPGDPEAYVYEDYFSQEKLCGNRIKWIAQKVCLTSSIDYDFN